VLLLEEVSVQVFEPTDTSLHDSEPALIVVQDSLPADEVVHVSEPAEDVFHSSPNLLPLAIIVANAEILPIPYKIELGLADTKAFAVI
jgi:hypothetical protein